MAGDWIKLEATTPDKPEVHAIAQRLNMNPDEVLGKLARLFIWYDQHLVSCNAVGVTDVTLSRVVGNAEFVRAVREVGWLHEENGTLVIHNFDRHNGEPAKKRALNQRRVSDFRNRNVTPKALPEKRREEKSKEQQGARNFAPPAWLPSEAWKDYEATRVKLRKPLTDRARELAVAKLAHLRTLGHDPKAVLEASVLNGWAGLFELKPEALAEMKASTKKHCAYCERASAGSVNGIEHCDAHSLDAMDQKPRPKA